MIKLKATNTATKETKSFVLPESAKEVTLGKFLDFLSADDELSRLAVLTGIPKQWLSMCRADVLLSTVYANVRWLSDKNLFKSLVWIKPPDLIEVMHEQIKLKTAEQSTLGQFLAGQEAVKKQDGKSYLFAFPDLIGIFAQKGYDQDRREAVKEWALDQPLAHMYPLGNFFLSSFKPLYKNGIVDSKTNQQATNSAQASKSSKNTAAST